MPVPLFPLPNVVLLPRAVLPLHIFEQRYRAMTADALAGDKRIAMALLKPGWECSYSSLPAIEPVVCVGQVIAHEKLADGRYNLLLQGLSRSRVVKEADAFPYRTAHVEPIELDPVPDAVLSPLREKLLDKLRSPTLGRHPLGKKFADMLESPVDVSDVVDLMAFNLVDDLRFRQALLSQSDAGVRCKMMLDLLRRCIGAPSKFDGTFDPSLN